MISFNEKIVLTEVLKDEYENYLFIFYGGNNTALHYFLEQYCVKKSLIDDISHLYLIRYNPNDFFQIFISICYVLSVISLKKI